MKYVLSFAGETWNPLEEREIVDMCADGTVGEGAKVAKCIGLGMTHLPESILDVAVFREAIEEKKLREKLAREKFQAEHNPDPHLTLLVRDTLSDGIQRFTAVQIRNLFAHGKLSPDAEFKHPEYENWFPCRSLFSLKGSVSVTPAWEYYILPIDVSGASAGLVSAFTTKGVSNDSSEKLAEMGSAGWELVGVMPVTAGVIGSTWSNSALAFLKRQII